MLQLLFLATQGLFEVCDVGVDVESSLDCHRNRSASLVDLVHICERESESVFVVAENREE